MSIVLFFSTIILKFGLIKPMSGERGGLLFFFFSFRWFAFMSLYPLYNQLFFWSWATCYTWKTVVMKGLTWCYLSLERFHFARCLELPYLNFRGWNDLKVLAPVRPYSYLDATFGCPKAISRSWMALVSSLATLNPNYWASIKRAAQPLSPLFRNS